MLNLWCPGKPSRGFHSRSPEFDNSSFLFSFPLLWEQIVGGLLIGINYFGSSNELHGCVDDVHRMLPLVEQWGFAQEGCSQVLLLGAKIIWS